MVKATFSLLFVFGLGWIFGFLYVSRNFLWAAYIFTALNSCQGIGIFIFHCAMEKTIQESFRNWLRKQEWISQEVRDKISHSKSNSYSSFVSTFVQINGRYFNLFFSRSLHQKFLKKTNVSLHHFFVGTFIIFPQTRVQIHDHS